MAKCSHPDCSVELGLISTDLGLLCGLHLGAAQDIIRGEQRLINAEARIAELEAQLAALTWTPISESNLPKQTERFDVQILIYRPDDGKIELWTVVAHHLAGVVERGFTMMKHINPPSPERGAK